MSKYALMAALALVLMVPAAAHAQEAAVSVTTPAADAEVSADTTKDGKEKKHHHKKSKDTANENSKYNEDKKSRETDRALKYNERNGTNTDTAGTPAAPVTPDARP